MTYTLLYYADTWHTKGLPPVYHAYLMEGNVISEKVRDEPIGGFLIGAGGSGREGLAFVSGVIAGVMARSGLRKSDLGKLNVPPQSAANVRSFTRSEERKLLEALI